MARKSSTVPLASEQAQIKHYGFAIVPRIVIRGEKYKDMSLIERGLYQGLKDICGEEGECFYILRNLAKELHTSISTLSRYIPVLANKWGLITAEKKCRGNGTNKHEIFHIRIVNIWEENDALYKPQDCFTEKQSSVSDRNKVNGEVKTVSDRNNFVSDRNSIESSQAQLCFYLNDRMISINNTLSEEEHNSFVVANADDDSPIFSFPILDSGIEQVSDESFKIAVLDQWRVYAPPRINTSSQALEQILNRLSAPSSSQLSTPTTDLSPESVDKSAQTDNNTSVPQASEQPPIANATRPAVVGEAQPSETQPSLLERPKVPEMPPASMKLSAEKIVQITEAFLGEYYQTRHRGRQIAAARRILNENVTEEQYIAAYVDMVDWWNDNQGKLHVFDMAANTKRRQMRVLEIKDKIEARQKPPVNLEEKRKNVHKQTALEHGSRRSFLEEEKAREQSGIWGDLKKGTK